MKALTVKQPWASLIVHGIKDIENRTWITHFRGKIYIHASAKSVGKMKDILTPEQYEFVKNSGWKPGTDKPLSAIIGEVEIIDCVLNYSTSIWAERLSWNWVLANPVLYEKPIINVKGKLSFWEPTPNQICMSCKQKFFGQDPQYCCNGSMCGCMGQPVEPVVCSEECYHELVNKHK